MQSNFEYKSKERKELHAELAKYTTDNIEKKIKRIAYKKSFRRRNSRIGGQVEEADDPATNDQAQSHYRKVFPADETQMMRLVTMISIVSSPCFSLMFLDSIN